MHTNLTKPSKTDLLIKQLDTSEIIVICEKNKKCSYCNYAPSHRIPHKKNRSCNNLYCPTFDIEVECFRV